MQKEGDMSLLCCLTRSLLWQLAGFVFVVV